MNMKEGPRKSGVISRGRWDLTAVIVACPESPHVWACHWRSLGQGGAQRTRTSPVTTVVIERF